LVKITTAPPTATLYCTELLEIVVAVHTLLMLFPFHNQQLQSTEGLKTAALLTLQLQVNGVNGRDTVFV